MWFVLCEYVPRRYGHAYQCDMCVMETVWRFLLCGKTFGLYRAMDRCKLSMGMMQSVTAYLRWIAKAASCVKFYHDQ